MGQQCKENDSKLFDDNLWELVELSVEKNIWKYRKKNEKTKKNKEDKIGNLVKNCQPEI